MPFPEPGLLDMIIRLRGRGIFDNNLLRAMELVPRSAFLPPEKRAEAYDEARQPIASGQTMLAPLTAAVLCQSLDVQAKNKVYLLGAGSGYMTCVLAKMCTRIYATERYAGLVRIAETNIQPYASNAVIRHSDGRAGWRGQAPFDRVILTAAVRIVPSAIIDQTAIGGILIAVIDGELIKIVKPARGNTQETVIMPMDLPAIEAGRGRET